MNIIGKTYSRHNITIINGMAVKGDEIGKYQKLDEKKSEDGSNLEKITIYSPMAHVNISTSNSSKVEMHLHGRAIIDGDINFDVHVINSELRINLKFTGIYYNGYLKLDVAVPRKTFKAICVRTSSTDITFSNGISTEYLKITSQLGNLKTSANFTNASITTMGGNVKLRINAVQNICVDIFTISGDVSTEFKNTRYINLSTKSMSGKIKNRHKGGLGYYANANISTLSGDIKIK